MNEPVDLKQLARLKRKLKNAAIHQDWKAYGRYLEQVSILRCRTSIADQIAGNQGRSNAKEMVTMNEPTPPPSEDPEPDPRAEPIPGRNNGPDDTDEWTTGDLPPTDTRHNMLV